MRKRKTKLAVKDGREENEKEKNKRKREERGAIPGRKLASSPHK